MLSMTEGRNVIYIKCFFWLFNAMIFLSQKSVVAFQSFPDNSKVCFLGDSITRNGEFHHSIFQYYLLRYPTRNISFCNCGIAGDVLNGMLSRMDDDVFIHNPTHAIIMFGMNDLGGEYQNNSNGFIRDLNSYTSSMIKIIKLLKERNIQIILQTPSIYDDTVKLKSTIVIGRNQALFNVSHIVNDIGKEYQIPVVDYWTIMQNTNLKIQSMNPKDTIIGFDRVHPGPAGHLIMTYSFLHTMEKPSLLSHMVLSENVSISQFFSSKCHIHSLKRNYYSTDSHIDNHSIEAVITSYALPMVLSTEETVRKVLKFIPFIKDFNTEVFQVHHLISHTIYELSIDNKPIGTFNNSALAIGINLTNLKHTPQHVQSTLVHSILMKLWELEGHINTIKFVEHNFFRPFYRIHHMNLSVTVMKNETETESLLHRIYLERFANESVDRAEYFKGQLNGYLMYKKKEKEMIQQIESLQYQSRLAAMPITRTYSLIKIS